MSSPPHSPRGKPPKTPREDIVYNDEKQASSGNQASTKPMDQSPTAGASGTTTQPDTVPPAAVNKQADINVTPGRKSQKFFLNRYARNFVLKNSL
jgi:hypothetical protein